MLLYKKTRLLKKAVEKFQIGGKSRPVAKAIVGKSVSLDGAPKPIAMPYMFDRTRATGNALDGSISHELRNSVGGKASINAVSEDAKRTINFYNRGQRTRGYSKNGFLAANNKDGYKLASRAIGKDVDYSAKQQTAAINLGIDPKELSGGIDRQGLPTSEGYSKNIIIHPDGRPGFARQLSALEQRQIKAKYPKLSFLPYQR